MIVEHHNNDKAIFTQRILDELPEQDRISFDLAMRDWWQDIRDIGGLRLSISGFQVFNQLNLARYEFDVPPATPAKPSQLITLNSKLDCPYYIQIGKKPKLILFESKQAMMFALYGDLQKFLEYLGRS